MYYNISKILDVLPYVSWIMIAVFLVIFEIKNYRTVLADRDTPDSSRGGFVPPPGDGYEYYAGGSILYILQKGPNRFRVYIVTGKEPSVTFKKDRYGRYFSVKARNNSTVEKIIEDICK